jgi:hypothetical protein
MNQTDKIVNKMMGILKDTLKGEREHTGEYTMPYTDNDDMVDFIIEYQVSKISLWKGKSDEYCRFEGTIYVKINRVLVGFKETDEWEKVTIEDLPSWVEDDLKESIYEDINIFQGVCLDIDYSS